MTRAELLKIAKQVLFNTEMVKAILDGRKTVTRRVIKRKGYNEKIHNPRNDYAYKRGDNVWEIGYKRPNRSYPQSAVGVAQQCYPGDILYVRETWCWCPCWDCGFDTEEHKCIYAPSYKIFQDGKAEWGCYGYKASFEDNEYQSADTWHPSIHMPKEAARIFLKVKDVRVERLQDITEDEVEREGIKPRFKVRDRFSGDIAKSRFMKLWDSTIQKADIERYGWEANPWVWVIEFERIEPDKEV